MPPETPTQDAKGPEGTSTKIQRSAQSLFRWGWASFVFGLATAGVVWYIARTFQPAALRWTAYAAVLGGAAVLIGLVGLPVVFAQLRTVTRDLAHRDQLRAKLNQYRVQGSALDIRAQEDDAPELQSGVDAWVETVATFVRSLDEAEEQEFRRAGNKNREGPTHEYLDAKLLYLRNDLLPKIVAGFW